MATFERNSADGAKTGYKFYIENRTEDKSVYYDFRPLLKDQSIRTITGVDRGTIPPNLAAIFNFDSQQENLEQGDVSLLNIDGNEIKFRFWSSSTGSDQYINLNAHAPFKVTKDIKEISVLDGNGIRITVDGGGGKEETLNIHVIIQKS